MCRAAAFVLVASPLVCGASLTAQVPEPPAGVRQGPEQLLEADLIRTIDSLAPLVEQAAIEAESARLARLEAARARAATRRSLDTLVTGDVTVIAPLPDAEAAARLFGEVWSESYGGFESTSLRERTFTYQSATYDVEEILVDGIREQVVVPTWYSPERARARIHNVIGRAIAAELADTELGRWTQGNPFARRDPERLYREMVGAGSLAVRRCLDGVTASCAAALGLRLGDDFLEVWYTPQERRERVLGWAGLDPTRTEGALPARWTNLYGQALQRCAGLETPDACDGFIRPDEDSWAPLPAYMRETVVALVVERGGPEAWSRLVEDPTMAPEEALAHAFGAPLDELVGEWRGWILASRPRAHAGLGGTSALALLWALVFATFAARSTRWRFD